MKIAVFSDSTIPEISGVATAVDNFCRGLAAKGHKLMLFCPRYKGEQHSPGPGIVLQAYFSVSLRSNKATQLALPKLRDMARKVGEFKPDIVHVHTPMAIGWGGIFAARAHRIPLIQTYHTYIPGVLTYLQLSKLTGLYSVMAKLHRKKASPNKQRVSKVLVWPYTRTVYNTSALILVPSKALKKELQIHGVKPKIQVLSNGVELQKIPVKQDYSPTFNLLHAGRLGHDKNLDVLVRAMKPIAEHHPKVRLEIYGDGPARAELERLSKRLGLADIVRFRGFVQRAQLLRLYEKFDLFVTPSQAETQGMVVLEAIASGLPVIGIDSLAIPELVINNKTGLLSNAGDSIQLANNIIKLLCSEKLRGRLGRAANRLAQSHDLRLMVDKLEEIYKKI
jgi:1,2-diacylglycerol 3-alpha-glucosyltransferase